MMSYFHTSVCSMCRFKNLILFLFSNSSLMTVNLCFKLLHTLLIIISILFDILCFFDFCRHLFICFQYSITFTIHRFFRIGKTDFVSSIYISINNITRGFIHFTCFLIILLIESSIIHIVLIKYVVPFVTIMIIYILKLFLSIIFILYNSFIFFITHITNRLLSISMIFIIERNVTGIINKIIVFIQLFLRSLFLINK